MAIAKARPIVARMRRHGLQVESRASDEPPGPPTIRESIPQGRVTGQGSAKQTIRFATWNLNHPSSARLSRQIEFLQQLKCDIVALQEISANGGRELSQSGAFRWCWLSLPLRARAAHESTSRDQGCAILATDAFRPASEPDLLWNAAAPERTLVMELEHSGISLSVASLRQVAGADRKKWGPMKKRQQFDAISTWLEGRSERGIVGIDANSPEVDHPDVSRNGYFFGSRPGDQHEHLLHDPSRAPHQFRDALRVYLGAHPQEFDRIVTESPEGPLAVSHRNLGRPRRFDFIYITPDVGPETVSYLSGETMGSLSDHALVVADLAIGDQA